MRLDAVCRRMQETGADVRMFPRTAWFPEWFPYWFPEWFPKQFPETFPEKFPKRSPE